MCVTDIPNNPRKISEHERLSIVLSLCSQECALIRDLFLTIKYDMNEYNLHSLQIK